MYKTPVLKPEDHDFFLEHGYVVVKNAVPPETYVIQYSVDGAYDPETGEVYDNGPVVALGGKPGCSGLTILSKERE